MRDTRPHVQQEKLCSIVADVRVCIGPSLSCLKLPEQGAILGYASYQAENT